MNPEITLEEARVLESFNLTHQAVELLQESLEEHPGHAGLQAAINRISGVEQPADSAGGDENEAVGSEPDTATADAEEADQSGAADQPAEEPRLDNAQTETVQPPENEEDAEASSEPPERSGEIAWDEDFDDMLATPEPESAPGSDDNLMEFDDSFALETPSDEQSSKDAASVDEPVHDEESSLELPDNEEPVASGESPKSATSEAEPEALDLDLSGYQPAGEETTATQETVQDEGLDLGMAPEEEEGSTADSTSEDADADDEGGEDVDTRVSLAEAFLDVGDRESFDMIESELREEGATAALQRLDELKQRYDT
jgi:pilus assembly protein FimV